MADLGILNPNAAVANTTNDWAVGTFADIDEPLASADGNATGDDTNANGDRFGRYALTNVPADLDTVDTVLANVRYRVTGAQSNTRGLFARIVTDEATPVNLTDEVTVNTAVSNTTFQNSGALSFTIQGTPTKAQWDNAVIQLRLNVSKNMAGDTNGIRVDAVDVTGTYTAASSSFSGSAAVTQAADTSSASGTHTPPVFTGTASPTQAADTSAASGTFTGGGGTTITENWNCTDSTTSISCQLTWARVAGALALISNRVEIPNVGDAWQFDRAEADLSTDDHYAEADITWDSGSPRWGGTCVRFSPSAETFYFGGVFGTSSAIGYRIMKVVAGSQSVLAEADNEGGVVGLTKTIRVTATDNGADVDLELFVNGVSKLTATDTTSPITGNLRTGIGGQDRAGAGRFVWWDNFTGADLAGSDNRTGTAAPTQADQTSTASGTFTAPSFIGSAAPIQTGDTSTASGTFTDPVFTGSAAPTQELDTAAASGTFTPGTLTGTANPTQEDDTSTSTGTFTAPSFTGSASPTQADDTSTASATFTVPTFTGTSAAVEADDTSTAAGTFTSDAKIGSAAAQQESDTSTAVGTFVAGPVTGSADPTQADDTLAASGTFVAPSFEGTAAVSQAAQTSTASGTFTIPTFTGSAAVTQADQVSAGVGVNGSEQPFDPIVVAIPFVPKIVVPVVFEPKVEL